MLSRTSPSRPKRAHLRSLAARAGEPPEAFADALLAEVLTDYEATLAGIERGLTAAA